MKTGERPTLIRRVTGFAGRHKALTGIVLGGGLALTIFLLLWFTPWRLFTDVSVDEEFPGGFAAPPTETASPSPNPSPEPSAEPKQTTTLLSSGKFRDLEHRTTGTAKIFQLPDGRLSLRLEDLDTSNGPDLIVLLSATPATEDEWGAYDDDEHISLGGLKGNKGNQNYSIPDDVDLSRYNSVVVWCRRFTVGFGAAPITL